MQGRGSGAEKRRAVTPGCPHLPGLPTLSSGARTHPKYTGTHPCALERVVVKDIRLGDWVTH